MQGIAALTGATDPRFVDLPHPGEPGPGQVLCRTLQLGVCGTDREILTSGRPWTPAGCDYLVLGHECLGRVEGVGPGVEDLKTGDLVAPSVRRPLGAAPWRVDLLSWGEYEERGIVRRHGFSAPWWIEDPAYLFRVPRELSRVAVLTEPLSVAEKGINEAVAIQEARLGPGTWQQFPPRVLVTGLGPIGFGALLGCIARRWPTMVYGRDREDGFRPSLARELGAGYLRAQAGVFDELDADTEGFDLILECTGSDEVMLASSAALASRGVMVWLGSTRVPRPARRNVALLMRSGIVRNHVHVACVNSAPRDFEDALAHLAWFERERPELLPQVITDRVAPAESLWHYSNRRPDGIKTVLMYED